MTSQSQSPASWNIWCTTYKFTLFVENIIPAFLKCWTVGQCICMYVFYAQSVPSTWKSARWVLSSASLSDSLPFDVWSTRFFTIGLCQSDYFLSNTCTNFYSNIISKYEHQIRNNTYQNLKKKILQGQHNTCVYLFIHGYTIENSCFKLA